MLVAVCLCLLLMLAGLGLGVDLNRMLAVRSAMGSAAEATALAAVLELDGTPAGIERARTRAAATWQRHAVHASSTLLEFSSSASGPWLSDPQTADPHLTFARFSAYAKMPLTLLSGVTGEKTLPVDVAARAGQVALERVETGLLPLAVRPDGRLLDGLTVAVEPGEARLAILNGLAFPVKTGDRLAVRTGAGKVERETLREIVWSDTDPGSATYADYARRGTGNGRRLILLPVTGEESRVTGFAGFFLLPADAYAEDQAELRLEPAGGYLAGSRRRAAAEQGAWRAEVIQ